MRAGGFATYDLMRLKAQDRDKRRGRFARRHPDWQAARKGGGYLKRRSI
jgi:hypothetical protein